MIRKILLIILLFCLISCSSEKQTENEFDIKGYFKKLTVIKSLISKDSLGNSFKDTISIVVSEIGKNGKAKKVISKTYVCNKPFETITSKLIYNSKRQIVKKVTDMGIDKNEFEINYFYKNDLLDFLTMNDSWEDITFGMNEKYTYDSIGKLKFRESNQFRFNFINKDTLFLEKGIFTYDNNGNLIKADWSKRFFENHNWIVYFTNDSIGNVTKTIFYHKFEKILNTSFYKYEYVYNSNKNWIERKTFKNDVLFQITERIIE